jgi:hypothetical protein
MNCLQCFIAFMQPVVKLDSGHLPDLEKALASGGIIDLCGCTFSGELAQSILLVGSNTTLCNGTILLPNNSLVRAAGGTYAGACHSKSLSLQSRSLSTTVYRIIKTSKMLSSINWLHQLIERD